MATKTERVYFTVRLDASLRERLHRIAVSNYRSASREASIAIERYVTSVEALRGEPSPGHSVKVQP
jgi:predicted transcriptional regulator